MVSGSRVDSAFCSIQTHVSLAGALVRPDQIIASRYMFCAPSYQAFQ